MNKIVTILLMLLSLYGAEFHSYEDSLKIQKQSHKIIILDVMRSDCHFCIKMQKEVFANKEMMQWLEDRFILCEINLDFDELPLGLKVHFTPTFFFVDENSKILKTIPGSWNIEDFKDLTRKIK